MYEYICFKCGPMRPDLQKIDDEAPAPPRLLHSNTTSHSQTRSKGWAPSALAVKCTPRVEHHQRFILRHPLRMESTRCDICAQERVYASVLEASLPSHPAAVCAPQQCTNVCVEFRPTMSCRRLSQTGHGADVLQDVQHV